MVHHSLPSLDHTFAALADPTRRGILLQLGGADTSITNLAAEFRMTLTGIKKHVAVLERAGLVETEKVGRVRVCRLGRRRYLLAQKDFAQGFAAQRRRTAAGVRMKADERHLH